MNLKKLHENAQWQKLTEMDFRSKATTTILEQEEKIEKLSNTVVSLEETLNEVKKIVGLLKAQNTKLSGRITNQRIDDANNYPKQERTGRTVPQSR